MKKFLLSLFVIFLAYLAAYYTSGASEKQDLFDFGNSSMMYKIKCAITGETDTTDANALYYRANDYMIYQEYELAIKDYKRSIELDPTLAYARIDLAKAYMEAGDTSQAIINYKRQIEASDYPEEGFFNDENHVAYYHLANLYFNKNEFTTALNYVNLAIDQHNYELSYRNLRRLIYLKQNQPELAEIDYQYIVSSDPDYLGNYAEKAKIANDEGQYQKAVEYYKLALENKIDDKDLLQAKAWVYHSLWAYDSALIDFQRVAELYPDYYNYFNVAYTLDFLDNIEAAIEYYTKSIELKNDYYLSYNNRGYEYYRLERYKKAQADYTKSIELKGDYYLNYYNRGILFYKQKKYKKAIEDYKNAKEYAEDDKNIVYDIALAYDKLNKPEEAIYNYNEFLKLAGESDTARVDYAIGRVALLSNK